VKYPTFEEWFSGLPEATKDQTVALIAAFKANDADQPERWARSEIAENIPQLARYLILKRIWDCEIDRWSHQPERWVNEFGRYTSKRPIPIFIDAAAAIKRLLESGADVADLGAIARLVAFGAAFRAIYHVDEGANPDAVGSVPGWCLMETAADGKLTGREVGGLHESLLSIHEGRVRSAEPGSSPDSPGFPPKS